MPVHPAVFTVLYLFVTCRTDETGKNTNELVDDLPNAGAASCPVIPATAPGLNSVVIMYMETRPARPAVPSESSAIPTATPTANSQDMLSINAPPALIRNSPIE